MESKRHYHVIGKKPGTASLTDTVWRTFDEYKADYQSKFLQWTDLLGVSYCVGDCLDPQTTETQ